MDYKSLIQLDMQILVMYIFVVPSDMVEVALLIKVFICLQIVHVLRGNYFSCPCATTSVCKRGSGKRGNCFVPASRRLWARGVANWEQLQHSRYEFIESQDWATWGLIAGEL